MMIASLADLVDAIPAAWWGAIGGALLTLLGAAMNHWAESRRLDKRFKQEADTRRLERDADLRRQLFLEAADSAVSSSHILSSIANTSIPLNEIRFDPMNLGGLMKAHLVGSLETVKAFDGIAVALRSQTFKLMNRRMTADLTKADMDLVGARINELMATRQDLVTRMQALNREPTPQLAAVERLHQLFDSTKRELDDLIGQRDRLMVVWQEQLRELMLDATRAGADYRSALAKANIRVRRELGQTASFDVDEYQRHIEAAVDVAEKDVQRFMSEMAEVFRQHERTDNDDAAAE